MSGMEKLTQRARRALSLAHQFAERFAHMEIGSGHLLLGLISESGGVANRVLTGLGLEELRVEEVFTRIYTLSSDTSEKLELSAQTQLILQFSFEEAEKLGNSYISTEHLLLGLVRANDSSGLNVLRKLGVTPDQVRRQTRRILQESSSSQRATRRRPARRPPTPSLLDGPFSSPRDLIIKTENIPDNFKDGLELNILDLPDSLLYVQYLIKEFYKFSGKRDFKSANDKKTNEEIDHDELKLTGFSFAHLSLFQLDEILEAENYLLAFNMIQALTYDLEDYFTNHLNSRASSFLENLKEVEESFEEVDVKPIRDILHSLDTEDYKNPNEIAKKITDASNLIKALIKPKNRIVAKVNVFPHGHRDVFRIKSNDSLLNLTQKILNKYKLEIEEYLFKIYKLRIPFAEVQILFFSDSENLISNQDPLVEQTLISNIPNISTDGVTWYPQWVHHKKYQQNPLQIYEIPINSLDIPISITTHLANAEINTIGRLLEILEIGERAMMNLGLESEDIQKIKTILTDQQYI